MGAPIGTAVGFAGIVLSIIVGLIWGVFWGSTFLCVLAYMAFAFVIGVTASVRMPNQSFFMASLLPKDRQVAKMFSLFVYTPGAATLYAGLLNILRFALIVWSAICFYNEYYVLGWIAVAFFILTAWHVVRLDPVAHLGPRAAKGHAFSADQLTSLQRIRERAEDIAAIR